MSDETSLLEYTKLDAKDEMDEKWKLYHSSVAQMLASGASEREAHDILNATVCRGMQEHEEVSLGLLYGMLVNSARAQMFYSDLTFTTRDGLALVVGQLEMLVMEKYRRMKDLTRKQIIWVTNELVKGGTIGIEKVCNALLRQIEGGNVSPENIWLAESMLKLLIDNRSWLDRVPFLLCTAVYTYLRLIQDHSTPALTNLRNAEVEFTISLLRERFMECVGIGRDLVRLLQSVARVTEFMTLWKDIIQNPQNLSPHFSGVLQLLNMRTSRRFIVNRVTPDMETKLNFIMSKVKFGQQKKYQDWFQTDYLQTPESQSLLVDLIRYVCCVIHPSNEVLSSNIVQRWAVVGWLLTKCQSNASACSAKLALFYDWLFYSPDTEGIMNIEPAILVMFHSVNTHPAITATLLDFLVRMVPSYGEGLVEHVTQGIGNAVKDILDKRVISSLDMLVNSPRLDRDLIASFCRLIQPVLGFDERKGIENNKDDVVVLVEDSPTVTEQVQVEDKQETNEEPGNDFVAAGDELREVADSVEAGGEEMGDGSESEPKGVSTADMQMLSEPQQHWLGVLIESRDQEMRKKAVDRLFEEVSSAVDIDKESVDIMAKGVAHCLLEDFDAGCPLDQNMSDVGKNLPHSLFEFVNPDRPATIYRRVLGFLDKLRGYESRIGYHLLFYLKAKVVSGRTDQLALHHSLSVDLTVYHDLAKMSEPSQDFEDLVLGDLEACQSDDSSLFYFLLPEIYKQFPDTFLGSSQLLYVTVSYIDSVQLNDLICQLSLSSFKMFGEERVVEAIKASLEWETFEQFSVWQLLSAEAPPLQEVLKILPLDSSAHPEALSGLLFLLRACQPASELLVPLLQMPLSDSLFTVTILYHWAVHRPTELVTPVIDCLGTAITQEHESVDGSCELSSEAIIQYISELQRLLPPDNHFFSDADLKDTLASFSGFTHASRSINRMVFYVDNCSPPPSTPKWMKKERKRSHSLSDSEQDVIQPTAKMQRSVRRLEDSDDDS